MRQPKPGDHADDPARVISTHRVGGVPVEQTDIPTTIGRATAHDLTQPDG
ncbi:hypothetical protein [Pseudonocardia sp.]